MMRGVVVEKKLPFVIKLFGERARAARTTARNYRALLEEKMLVSARDELWGFLSFMGEDSSSRPHHHHHRHSQAHIMKN
jgi:hypothetical protein